MGTWLALNTMFLAVLSIGSLLALQWMYTEIISQRRTIKFLTEEIALLKGHVACNVALQEMATEKDMGKTTAKIPAGNGAS